jgi:hypothetical protein
MSDEKLNNFFAGSEELYMTFDNVYRELVA